MFHSASWQSEGGRALGESLCLQPCIRMAVWICHLCVPRGVLLPAANLSAGGEAAGDGVLGMAESVEKR